MDLRRPTVRGFLRELERTFGCKTDHWVEFRTGGLVIRVDGNPIPLGLSSADLPCDPQMLTGLCESLGFDPIVLGLPPVPED